MRSAAATVLACLPLMAAPVLAGTGTMKTPVAASAILPGCPPGFRHPDYFGFRSGPMHDAILRGLAAGSLATLPGWSLDFTVDGKSYS